MGDTVTMTDQHGTPLDVPVEQVQDKVLQGFHVEGAEEHVNRVADQAKQDYYSAPGAKVVAGGAALFRGATGGLSDVGLRALYGDQGQQDLAGLREANPGISTAGDVVGSFVSPIGEVGKAIEGGLAAKSVLGRLGSAAVGYGAEGALYGAGSGVSELALDDHPLTVERVGSVLSSHMLYGGAIGGAAGSLGKLAEIGLSKARGVIDSATESAAARNVTDDLAAMDRKQLGVAKQTELDAIKASHETELTALKEQRATDNKALADEIKSYHREVKDSQWATTKDLEMPAAEGRMSAGQLGRDAIKADNQLANVLGNPIGLAKNPTKALDALQRQESAYVNLLDHSEQLKAAYATDALGGKRIAALENTPVLLEKNRALQERIAKATEPLPTAPTTSARLDAIEAAKEGLATGGLGHGLASIPQRMLEGSVFGTVAHGVASLAIPGAGMASHLVGAAASKFVGEKVFGRLGKAVEGQAARAGKAASAFLGTAERVAKVGPPIATKVLASVRYASEADKPSPPRTKGTSDLAHHYAARTDEIRSLVQPGPTGKSEMRPDARAKVADVLGPIGHQFPMLADALESLAALKVTFLADRIPRKPDVFAYSIGPDRWQPGEMEMRKFARYVAGVEDPHGILDRVAHGVVSPEDAEVMHEVYPEMLQDLRTQIATQASKLTKPIPYQKRLAYSILTGDPIDPAMDPRILGVLQASFTSEQGSEGGTQAPTPSPQFGSVSKSLDQPTPAQKRAG